MATIEAAANENMWPPFLSLHFRLQFILMLFICSLLKLCSAEKSDNNNQQPAAGDITVPIYKGPQPWAPLTRAKAFGLKTANLQVDEPAVPVQPAETISEQLDAAELEAEGSGEAMPDATEISAPSPDYIDQEQLEIEQKNIRADLHESLRQPLKRLSNRQLALLLKQVRKQRRIQQQIGETETSKSGNEEDMSRKEMLGELRQLLRQPADGQKLIRPRLLTNINIVPSEWSIYPPKREGSSGPKEIGQNVQREEATPNADAKNETETGQILLAKIEANTTEEANITLAKVETIEFGGEAENATEAGSIAPGSKENMKASVSDEAKAENQQNNNFDTIETNLSKPRPGDLHAAEFAPLESENLDNSLTEDIATTTNASKIDISQQQQVDNEKEHSTAKDEVKIAQLTAHWRVLEQKFASEMRTAVQNAGQAIVEAEQKLIANQTNAEVGGHELQQLKQQKNQSSNSLLFSSKTWAASNSSESLFAPSIENGTAAEGESSASLKFAELERIQLTELSTQLRQIRLRYETLKRQYLAKMRQWQYERQRQQGNRLNGFKAAGAATFLDGDQLVLKTTIQNGDANVSSTENANGTINNSRTEEEPKIEGTPILKEKNITEEPQLASELKQKQLRLEELRREQELAKKVLSSEVDELQQGEIAEQQQTTTTNNPDATTKIVTSKITEAIQQNDGIKNESNDAASTINLNSNSTLNAELSEASKSENLANTKKLSAKTKNRPLPNAGNTKKMPTLAELAEELSRLAEAMIGKGSNNGSFETTKTTTIESTTIPTNRQQNIGKDGLVSSKIPQLQKTKKPKQQPKNVTQSNSSLPPQTSSNITNPLSTNQQSVNAGNSSLSTSNDFLNQQAGLPATPLRVVPTPRKRILTAEWLSRSLHIDTSTESAPAATAQQKTPTKLLFDTGRKKGEGRMAIGGTKNETLLQKPQALKQQKDQPNNSSAPFPNFIRNTNHTVPNRLLKRPPLNQNVAIGTRAPPRNQNLPQALNGSQIKQNSQQQQQQTLKISMTRQKPSNGGFYQLDRAQIANVGAKPNEKPSQNDFKVKGVSQVQVEASRDQNEQQQQVVQLDNEQLQTKLREQAQANGTSVGDKHGQESEDLANLEEFARIDEQAICDAIGCNFETGSLCEWESSVDELNSEDPRSKRYLMARRLLLVNKQRKSLRRKRSEAKEAEGKKVGKDDAKPAKGEKKPINEQKPKASIVLRSWHNWVGRYKNSLTGIARAEVFSTRNQRFAASYLRPGERSTLAGRLLSGEKATIRFRAWEATRDLQLRLCCDGTDRDEQCVFQTDRGIRRGTRRWLEHTAICPQGTKKIIFECRNLGRFQGACGLDNIQLVNDYCPSVTPLLAPNKRP